jgi:hypothetical protein
MTTLVNRGKSWKEDEVIQLLLEIRQKKTVQTIAEIHQRTVGGIYSRLRQLAWEYHNEGKTIDQIERYTGLPEFEIRKTIAAHHNAKLANEKRSEAKKTIRENNNLVKSNTNILEEILSTLKDIKQLLAHNAEA